MSNRRNNPFRVIDGDHTPTADVRIGELQRLQIFGFADLSVPLVELRGGGVLNGEHLHLTVEQAEAIAEGLIKAAAKARGRLLPEVPFE